MARTKTTFKLRDFFVSYEKQHGDNPDLNLNFQAHNEIAYALSEAMKKDALHTGVTNFPNRMGKIKIFRIKRSPDSRHPIDFKASKELNTTVYHTNDHSDGLICKIAWNREKVILYDKNKWSFGAVRPNFKRQIKPMILNGVTYPVIIN